MATEGPITDLGREKLAHMRELLEVTQRQLLLVNLDDLAPLLEHKERLIARIREVDRAIRELEPAALPEGGQAPWQGELDGLVEAILANEQTMEGRIRTEHGRLRRELQALDRQGQVKQYLEQRQPRRRSVDLKQ